MITLRERYRGALLGLAAGDAVGTTVEFSPPGTFTPVTDMVGGGPFHLRPGEWTDDTSMALCLAESLLEPVSYTHLDVYKRQPVRSSLRTPWSSTCCIRSRYCLIVASRYVSGQSIAMRGGIEHG